MIIFVRSFVPDFDGKIKKYFALLDQGAITRHFVGWPRGLSEKQDSADATYYKRKADLGGGLRNIFNLFFWNWFVLRTLWTKRKQFSVVHAIDLDSAISAWIFAKVFRKRLIFDVYDKYSAVRRLPKFLVPLIDWLENVLIRTADLSILADQNRYAQHGLSIDLPNVIVLENVPQLQVNGSTLTSSNFPVKLGYFGVLEPINRGLEDMLKVAQQHPEEMILHVVGYGPLTECFTEASRLGDNIVFHGPKSSQEGLEIMSKMDILLGMYYKTVSNHLYASPNKYYEHLMLGRPLVTTEGTPPGEKVESFDTGWALGEGSDALEQWLTSLSPDDVVAKAQNARVTWARQYASYFETHYKEKYFARVLSWTDEKR